MEGSNPNQQHVAPSLNPNYQNYHTTDYTPLQPSQSGHTTQHPDTTIYAAPSASQRQPGAHAPIRRMPSLSPYVAARVPGEMPTLPPQQAAYTKHLPPPPPGPVLPGTYNVAARW